MFFIQIEFFVCSLHQGQFYTALIFIVSECVVGLLLTPVCLKINRFVGCYSIQLMSENILIQSILILNYSCNTIHFWTQNHMIGISE